MTESQPSTTDAESQPSSPQNNRAVILETLLAACVEHGFATFQDTSHLSIPKRTRQRVISQLRASGRFRRRGRKLYAVDLKADPKIQDLDIDLDAPPPARTRRAIRATAKELAEVKELNPEVSDEIRALFGGKKTLVMTTLELDDLLHERGILTKPPIPADDEPSAPPTQQIHVDERPEYFEHAPQTFLELLKCIPPGVERWAPGTEQWLKEIYDRGIDAGNSPETMFLSLRNVELPRHLRQRGFQMLCRFPGVSWSRARFNAHIDAALKADERLQALPDGHRDKGKIVVDVIANTIEEILRGVANEQRPPPPPPTPSSTPVATKRPRETADPERWYAQQERELRTLKAAIDNDYRTHVHMDSGVDRFVKATAAIGRAQPLPKKSN
jgi:hypothetical protein